MKKTVFANWGTAQQGKSSTVKKVAQLILKNYPHAISDPNVIDFSGDIQIVITFGKIKIGIESQGDPNSRLLASLDHFVNISCDVIICSTRTSGTTVEAVNDLNKKHRYDNVWITNYRSNEKNQDLLNDLSAQHIFELVQDIINGKV